MGIAYRIDQEIGMTFVVFDRLVTDDDFIAHTHRLMADPAWPPARKMHLTDVTTQSSPHLLTASTIEQMAVLWGTRADQLKGMRIAVVANEAFANARLFEMTIARYGPTTIVFNMLSTACVWLRHRHRQGPPDVPGAADRVKESRERVTLDGIGYLSNSAC